MNPTELNMLVKKRGILRMRLSKLDTFVKHFDNTQVIEQLKGRLKTAEGIFNEFNGIQTDLEVHDDKIDEHLEYRDNFESLYWDVVSGMQIWIQQSDDERSIHSATNSKTIRARPCMKLPPIAIPNFEGDYTTWVKYHDTFVAMIHNNEDLVDIQKFHYLISSLKGEALQVP